MHEHVLRKPGILFPNPKDALFNFFRRFLGNSRSLGTGERGYFATETFFQKIGIDDVPSLQFRIRYDFGRLVLKKHRDRFLEKTERRKEYENRIQRFLGHEGFPPSGYREIQGDKRNEQDEKPERRVFPFFGGPRVEKVSETERHEGDSEIDDSRVPFQKLLSENGNDGGFETIKNDLQEEQEASQREYRIERVFYRKLASPLPPVALAEIREQFPPKVFSNEEFPIKDERTGEKIRQYG